MKILTAFKRLLVEVLKTRDAEKGGDSKYSLSRVLLFTSANLYIVAVLFGYFLVWMPGIDVNINILNTSIEALRWPILTFSAYSFGGKLISGLGSKSIESK